MKKIFTIALILASYCLSAQTYQIKFAKSANERQKLNSAAKSLFEMREVSFTTFSVPITFLRVENNKITTPIAGGLSYVYVKGKGRVNPDLTVTVEPTWFAGVYSDVGLLYQNQANLNLSIGGIIGVDKIALLVGHSVNYNKPIIGFSYKFDGFKFTNKSAKFLSLKK